MSSKKSTMKPIALAIGTTVAGAVLASSAVQAASNPFAMTDLASGYQVAMEEGKCGGMKKDAEGKCGGMKKDAEGKCGGMKKDAEGKCGGMKK
ncbi:MAG: hypothetical protein ACWA5X_08615, partial [bacterium]